MHARHPQILLPETTFLLVIDVQPSLMAAVAGGEAVAGNCAQLMDAARILGVPTVVTVQNRDKLGEPVAQVAERMLAGASALNKMTFSCMGDDAIHKAVRALGRRQALVCGVEAHVCVCQTALDLLASGAQVHVAADAVSSRLEANRLAALDRMRAAGVVISTVETAIYEMLERAGTDPFRQVLRLVR
ncbi:MAG: isochorismatase family protein [Armatimonadetes bacterium]|nr:isochorismatase family protein [Armatimonadota bacterium]